MLNDLLWKYYIRKFLDSNIIEWPYEPFSVGDLDLSDHIFIITGASSSIAKQVIGYLKMKEAIVIKVSRSSEDIDKNEYRCDLSDPRQIIEFCDKVKAKYTKLNGIVNIASGLYKEYGTNEFGVEKTFATNVLAPYLLFRNLLPLIESSGLKCIVNIVNPLMLTEKLDSHNINSENPYYSRRVFLQCERRKVELWHHLAEKYPGIRFNSMIPGFADTKGLKEKFPLVYLKYSSGFILRTLKYSHLVSYLIVWCLASPKQTRVPNGHLIFDGRLQREYVFKEHKTTKEEHERFISNFFKLLENGPEMLNC